MIASNDVPGDEAGGQTGASTAPEEADSIPEEGIKALTDRQQEALEAAYRAGYFDWPRESTAEEVADVLDISPPTLHAHLRKAEGQLFADLIDQEPREQWLD